MGLTEGVSQLFLAGRGDRSYFDMRAIQYTGFSEFDVQGAIPVIHPVIDYSRTLSSPVLGGEFGYSTNVTSLSRTTPEFDPINRFANLTYDGRPFRLTLRFRDDPVLGFTNQIAVVD